MAVDISKIKQALKEDDFADDPLMRRIAITVHKRRKIKGLTRQQLSDKSGVSMIVIRTIELGTKNYSMYSLLLVCRALKMSTRLCFVL